MIFVTGGTGLVGSHLLRALVEQSTVRIRACKRATSSMDLVSDIADKIEWIETDILDVKGLEIAMQGVSQVYHCAAVISFASGADGIDWMKKVNVDGTANVVNMALLHGVKKMVHVSSIAAIGRNLRTFEVSETNKWEESSMNTQYGISKYLAEREVWRGMAEGLDVAVVNPSVILGEGTWQDGSSRLFRMVYDGLKFYPPGGSAFVDVLDLVATMIQLMNSKVSGERFIISAENLLHQEFFNLVAAGFNKPGPSIKVNKWLGEIAWRVYKLKALLFRAEPLMTKETIRLAQKRYYYDNQKIKETLGFSFRSVNQSVNRICNAFLEEQSGGK